MVSWLFQQKILLTLPVEALRKHYHDWNGRPKELYSMIGLMILQQMHDLTDEQAVEQFCFNIQWHYALNITSPELSSSELVMINEQFFNLHQNLLTDYFTVTIDLMTLCYLHLKLLKYISIVIRAVQGSAVKIVNETNIVRGLATTLKSNPITRDFVRHLSST